MEDKPETSTGKDDNADQLGDSVTPQHADVVSANDNPISKKRKIDPELIPPKPNLTTLIPISIIETLSKSTGDTPAIDRIVDLIKHQLTEFVDNRINLYFEKRVNSSDMVTQTEPLNQYPVSNTISTENLTLSLSNAHSSDNGELKAVNPDEKISHHVAVDREDSINEYVDSVDGPMGVKVDNIVSKTDVAVTMDTEDSVQILATKLFRKINMRQPGIEPGAHRWQR